MAFTDGFFRDLDRAQDRPFRTADAKPRRSRRHAACQQTRRFRLDLPDVLSCGPPLCTGVIGPSGIEELADSMEDDFTGVFSRERQAILAADRCRLAISHLKLLEQRFDRLLDV